MCKERIRPVQYLGLLLLCGYLRPIYSAPSGFETIPGTGFETTDPSTGIKLAISVSEFLISRTEVTQEEFSRIMNYNPSLYKGSNRPVENVSWWEAIRYCNLRSAKEKLQPCYNLSNGDCDFSKDGYRLPTDAEWDLAKGASRYSDLDTFRKHAQVGSANTQNRNQLLETLRSGTKEVGSHLPNEFGLYDMLGNVWEWCNDFYDPVGAPISLRNPAGPSSGLARIIRGGSFISSVTSWNEKKGYRSSMKPDYKSRFTGIRLCRRLVQSQSNEPEPTKELVWSEPYRQVPAGYANNLGPLSSLLVRPGGVNPIVERSQWQLRRKELKAKWTQLLGVPSAQPPEPKVRLIETHQEELYIGKLMELQVEPDFWEKIYLMVPAKPLRQPAPAVIVPYYDVDTPAGKNMGGRSFTPMSARSFAYLMVQQGYIAVAIRWFGESYGESYDEAVTNLMLRHPHSTGLGKWVWDSQRLLDYLSTLPEVDHDRLGIIGHSLGAKMALYAAAMDERITAVVASEGGIGLSFSNYDDYWYFGDFIHDWDKSVDQHELLGLIAPRAFLLIGGDEYDTDKSWYYINSAKQVYSLLQRPNHIGYFNHHNGHTPPPLAVEKSIEWLSHFLGTY